MGSRRSLPVGTLCSIVARGRIVFATEFYGAYPNGSDFEARKTTGDDIESINAGRTEVGVSRAFPFLRSSSLPVEEGTPVVVVHEPVAINHPAMLKHMCMRRGSRVCEVLVPTDNRTRWVRIGSLRRLQ